MQDKLRRDFFFDLIYFESKGFMINYFPPFGLHTNSTIGIQVHGFGIFHLNLLGIRARVQDKTIFVTRNGMNL